MRCFVVVTSLPTALMTNIEEENDVGKFDPTSLIIISLEVFLHTKNLQITLPCRIFLYLVRAIFSTNFSA